MMSSQFNDIQLMSSSSREPTLDQFFLLNFVMSNYLGPDVYSDNPRRSASHRLVEGLAPYTSKNLGFSYVSVTQLESLYHYVLRKANSGLLLSADLFRLYLNGNLYLPCSVLLEDGRQFPHFFPLNIHEHKRFSEGSEIVRGLVVIDDPDASRIKHMDIERFKYLSRLDCLKIDKLRALSYDFGSSKGEEGEQDAGRINGKPIRSIQATYKRTRLKRISKVVASDNVMSASDHQKEGESSMDPQDSVSDLSIVLTGTAKQGVAGKPVGVVDIGVCKRAYFFRIAVPALRKDYCEFSCEIESSGRVHIQGSTSGGKTIKKRSRVFRMKYQQLSPPGPFTISFSLPGPVDPRLFSPELRSDGIFEGVVVRNDHPLTPLGAHDLPQAVPFVEQLV